MTNLHDRNEICKKVGIKRNTLATWIFEGYIVPTQISGRQGRKDFFDKAVVQKIGLLKALTESGVQRHLAVKLIDKCNMIPTMVDDGFKYTFTLTATIPNY